MSEMVAMAASHGAGAGRRRNGSAGRSRRRTRRANLTVVEFVAVVAAALKSEAGTKAIAARLMRDLNGRRVPRLTADRVSRETRDAAIRADLDAGHTYAETARRNRVSEYTVWRAAQRA